MLKFVLLVFTLWLLVRFIDTSGQMSFCHGKLSVGTIWIQIPDKNIITLGDKPFTDAALKFMGFTQPQLSVLPMTSRL